MEIPTTHTPLQPAREDVRPDERDAYDEVVARQEAYDYESFAQRVPPEHRTPDNPIWAMGELHKAGRVQPYYGALLHSPLIARHLSDLAVIYRTRGQTGRSYADADREWIDMVLAEELQAWGVYYAHMMDAVAVGVRPEAIKALREGRDEDLTRDELQLAKYIRQVARGRVTSEAFEAIEQRFGVVGAVEFTAFVGHLLMTIRLIQAFDAQPASEHQVDELVEHVVSGTVELPSPKDRTPKLENA